MPENKSEKQMQTSAKAWREEQGFCRSPTLYLCKVERKALCRAQCIPVGSRASMSRELGAGHSARAAGKDLGSTTGLSELKLYSDLNIKTLHNGC